MLYLVLLSACACLRLFEQLRIIKLLDIISSWFSLQLVAFQLFKILVGIPPWTAVVKYNSTVKRTYLLSEV